MLAVANDSKDMALRHEACAYQPLQSIKRSPLSKNKNARCQPRHG